MFNEYWRMQNLNEIKVIQKVIGSEEESLKMQEMSGCDKCEKQFPNVLDLKTHIRSEHQTFRPCRNFAGKSAEDTCTYGDKCNFNHVQLGRTRIFVGTVDKLLQKSST